MLASPIHASMMQMLAKFCACSTAGCARVRHCTRHKLDAEILQRQNVFAATPAEVLVRYTSTTQKICNEFARFLCENCSIVAPNARFNRRFFRRTTRQQLNSEVLQRQHVFAATLAEIPMQCVTLRVDRAENSQRIREFSGVKKNAQSPNARFFRRATRH